jgi:hypothetical protein
MNGKNYQVADVWETECELIYVGMFTVSKHYVPKESPSRISMLTRRGIIAARSSNDTLQSVPITEHRSFLLSVARPSLQ